jgi:hypothetical protein
MLQLSSSPSGDDDGDDGEGVSTAERQQRAEEASAYADLFDVTLTDGALKRKCLLHPSLNSLVYAGRLAPDMVIKVSAHLAAGSVQCSAAITQSACLFAVIRSCGGVTGLMRR